MEPKAAAAWVVGLVVVVGSLWLWSVSPALSELRECDEAIKSQLRAPATYNRVSPTISDVLLGSVQGIGRIEYDAENALGVPLRGKGLCFPRGGDGPAGWFERD